MAVAHDNATESHTGATGSASESSFTWEHDPVGTPRGVTVMVVNLVSAAFIATSVTYEDVDVPEVTACRAQDTAGEPGAIQVFHLGVSVPTTDPATVVVNRTNNTDELWAVCITQTAADDTEIYEPGIVKLEGDGTFAVQSVDDGSPGTNSLRYAGTFSGLANPPTAGTGSANLPSFDTGNQTATAVRETTAGQGARNVGFSSGTSDDRAAVHFAVKEGIAAPDQTITADSPVVHTRAFGTPAIALGAATVAPSGVVRTRAFGTAILARGPVTIVQDLGVVHTRAFGNPTVDIVEISAPSVVHERAFGTAIMQPQVGPTSSVVHTRVATSPILLMGLVFITPSSIIHTRAFGNPTLVRGAVTLFPSSVIHTRAIGTVSFESPPSALEGGDFQKRDWSVRIPFRAGTR